MSTWVVALNKITAEIDRPEVEAAGMRCRSKLFKLSIRDPFILP